MTKELSGVVNQDITTDGLVGQILALESQAKEIREEVKSLESQADGLRDVLKEKMLKLSLKTIKHSSGVSVQIANDKSIKIVDPEVVMLELKKLRVDGLLIKTIPKHQEIDDKAFKSWIKGQGINELIGTEIEQKQVLRILNNK